MASNYSRLNIKARFVLPFPQYKYMKKYLQTDGKSVTVQNFLLSPPLLITFCVQLQRADVERMSFSGYLMSFPVS